MLRVLQIIFSVITLLLATYGLMTKDFQFGAYMILFLGLALLLLGLQEFKKNNKTIGWILIGVFVYATIVSVQSFVK